MEYEENTVQPDNRTSTNMNEIILMAHVMFGVLCMVGSVWLFVDVLHVTAANQERIRKLSLGIAVLMWLGYLVAGYWYVTFYSADKAVILKGPWPFAHSFFMETKEHVVIVLLLLATYLPIAAANDLVANHEARRLVLCVAGLIALTALLAEGMGGIIAMGVKVGLKAA
jgi:hypothetical protein